MRKIFIGMGITAALLTAGISACHRPQTGNGGRANDEPLPGSPREVVLVGAGTRVTMHDYNQCIALHRFNGRFFSKRALANTDFQSDEIIRCFQVKLMQDYVHKNGLEAGEAARNVAIEKAMAHSNVGSPEKLMQKLGITKKELDEVAGNYYLQQIMQKDLMEKLDDEKAWNLFKIDARRYSVDLIDFPNEPTDDEIRAYAESHPREIETYVNNHPELMHSHPRAHFVRLGYPKKSEIDDSEAETKAFRNAAKLREVASLNGMEGAISGCRADAPRGCVILNDENNLHIVESNPNNRWAFHMPVGGVSDVIHGKDYAELWILREIEPPVAYDLKDQEVKKMLVRRAMTAMTAAPHLLSALRPALEVPEPNLREIAKKYGGQYRSFADIPYAKLVKDEKIESSAVMHVLAQMKPEESRLFSNPIVDQDRVYVFYVSQMKPPTREDFVRDGKAWRDFKAKDPDTPMTRAWLDEHIPSMMSMNRRPIEAEYGILQVNGTIR